MQFLRCNNCALTWSLEGARGLADVDMDGIGDAIGGLEGVAAAMALRTKLREAPACTMSEKGSNRMYCDLTWA